MQDIPVDHEQGHASGVLQRLIAEAPPDFFTLEWLIGNLPNRSFGLILFFVALIGLLPVISYVSSILIIILTFQIICGYRNPVLPKRIMVRPLPSKYLKLLSRDVVPALRQLERVVHPRWPIMLKGTRRFTAFVAMSGTILLLPSPVPLSNMPVAAIAALMALAYIEHDGLMLFLALISAFILLTFAVWLFFHYCLH